MLTSEEQAFQDRMLGGGTEKAVHKDYMAPAQPLSVKEIATSAGVDYQKIQKQLDDENNKEPGAQQATGGDTAAAAIANKGAIATDLRKGVVQGGASLVQGAGNFAIELLDSAENFAADHGIGAGDIITDASRMNWAEKLQSPEDSVATRAARGVTQYVAPVLATMGAGGGVAMGLGAGAISDLLLMDPHQERLSTMLRDHVPEFKNYPPVIAAVLSGIQAATEPLANSPNEGHIEGRVKNMIEGVLMTGGTIGAAKTISGLAGLTTKAFKGSALLKNYIASQKAVPAAAEAATNLETGAVKIASEAELAANEAKISPPINYDSHVVEVKPPVTAEGVQPPPVQAFNTQNDDIINFAKNWVKENPVDVNRILSEPKPSAELLAQTEKLKQNPEEIKNLLAWTKDQGPISDAHTKLAHAIMFDLDAAVRSAGVKAAEANATPEDLLHLSEMIDTFQHITNVEKGIGSEASRSLSANKLIGDISGMPYNEFIAQQGKEAKASLVADLVKAHGGEDALRETAKRVKAINDLPLQVAIDRAAKKASLKEIAPLTGFQKTSKFIQSIAINGMLSSMKTPVRNIISNAMVATGTIAENYMAGAIGAGRKALFGGADPLTMAASNGYVRGMMGSFFEGLQAAGHAIGIPAEKKLMGVTLSKPSPVNVLKGDLVMQAAESDPAKKLANNFLGKMTSTTGMVINGTISAPSKINSTADAFFGTILARGKQYERAISEGEKIGLQGAELEAHIQERTANWTVGDHNLNTDFAQKNTFSKALDPESRLGKIDSAVGALPMGRVLFPFFKTNANIITYAVEHSPLAPMLGSTRTALMAGGRDADMAAAKITLGTMMLGGAAYLGYEGVITGPDTNNPGVKQALAESGGWQPDSVKINGHYVSYGSIDPFNSVMRAGAVLSNLRSYMQDDDYEQGVALMSAAVMDFMTPEMLVDGYARFFDAYGEAAKYGEKDKVAAAFADVASRFVPFGALQRDVKNLMDPEKRSMSVGDTGVFNSFVDRFITRYKANSPFFSAEIPAIKNLFGEPIRPLDGTPLEVINPLAVSSGDKTWLSNQLGKLSGFKENMVPADSNYETLHIDMPPKVITLDGVRLELNPQEYDKYVMACAGLKQDGTKIGAKTLREDLESKIKALGDVPTMMTAKKYHQYLGQISERILAHRQQGLEEMRRDPAIMERKRRSIEASRQLQPYGDNLKN
jgi:hypothetical protein